MLISRNPAAVGGTCKSTFDTLLPLSDALLSIGAAKRALDADGDRLSPAARVSTLWEHSDSHAGLPDDEVDDGIHDQAEPASAAARQLGEIRGGAGGKASELSVAEAALLVAAQGDARLTTAVASARAALLGHGRSRCQGAVEQVRR
jgi:hypothetical protein